MNTTPEHRENLLTAITYNILFANDIACGAIVQAVGDVRKSEIYSFDVKRRINGIEKSRHDYEHKIKVVVGDKMDYYMEACDGFTDNVDNDIRIFFYTIKNALDRDKFKYSYLVARLQWARAMVQAASQVWNDRTQEIADLQLLPHRTTLKRVQDNLAYLNMVRIKKQFADLLEVHFPKSDYISCPEGQRAFDIVCRKLYDAKAVLAAAIHENS